MATHRYISTTFWDDAWIQELDPSEKFVYLYLMTNPLTSISGVYKTTERRISFDTGYDQATIKGIMAKFSAANKAIRKGEWIILPTWPKHQNWEKSPTIKQGIIQELKALPEDIFNALYELEYRFDLNSVLEKRTPEKGKVKNETQETHTPSENGDTPPIPPTYPMDTPSENGDTSSGSMGKASTIKSYSNSISSEFRSNLGGNSIQNPNPENHGQGEYPVENQPPPNLLNIIKEKAKAQTFYLDDPVIRKIAKAIPNWQWFTNRHNIIDFVTQKIMEIYSNKPKSEHKKLFISAITSWDNIKDEYPDWLAKNNHADELAAIDELRRTPPKVCLNCGTDIEGQRVCPKCEGVHFFNEDNKSWEYQPHVDLELSFQEMRRRLAGGQKPEEKTPEEEVNGDDIDF